MSIGRSCCWRSRSPSARSAAAATTETPVVRLEGLYLAPDPVDFPGRCRLITRAAVARLEIIGCTLTPGGHERRDGTRAPPQRGLRLRQRLRLRRPRTIEAFVPTPDIVIQRSITGALAVDDRYRLDIEDSIVDAGFGVGDPPGPARFAIARGHRSGHRLGRAARLPGADLLRPGARVSGSAASAASSPSASRCSTTSTAASSGAGSRATADRLPPNHFCVHAPDARLAFTSERFNDPGYAQTRARVRSRIRTLGPDDDAMGAFGFLLDAHKWTNLRCGLREFMPVGVRPLIVPVT